MPFKTLTRRKKYQGRIFDVAEVRVRLPDGIERNYDLVEHGDSVTILPVDADGFIYFVTQHRVGSGAALMELPAGVLDEGEEPLTAARRELQEEIGMAAKEFQYLGGFYLAPGYTDEFMSVFLATDLVESILEPDEDEFIEVSRLSTSEVFRKAFRGDFADGKTLAALFLAQPYLKSQGGNESS